MKANTLIPIILSLAGSSYASETQAWLVNCIDKSASKYSEIALYPGWPSGLPAATVLVPTSHNSYVAWTHANINETLPDGTVFSVSEMEVSHKAIDAPAKLGDDEITCVPHPVENLYSKIDGSICSSVFQCAHVSVTSDVKSALEKAAVIAPAQKTLATAGIKQADASQDQTKVIFYAYDDKFVVDGQLHAGDIFSSIWNERDDSHFLGRAISFGPSIITSIFPLPQTQQCTITYTGHGDIPWTTTNGLSSTLLSVASQPNFLQYTSTKVRECTDTNEAHPPKCIGWTWETHWQTHIPARMDFNVVNVPPQGSGRNPSDQGELHYTISCPPGIGGNLGCAICKLLQLGTSSGALAKDVGSAWGTANVLVTAVCDLAGC
jgi:hypothetical protein